MIGNYHVLEGDNYLDLMSYVEGFMETHPGFEPLGGVSSSVINNHLRLYQAMYKSKEQNNKELLKG